MSENLNELPVAPQSGYTPCACRDCMDITVSSDMTSPELCGECVKARCPALPERVTYPESRYWNCQRDDAYGA